jgi:hypothetical protein
MILVAVGALARGIGVTVVIEDCLEGWVPVVDRNDRVGFLEECHASRRFDQFVQQLQRAWPIHPVERTPDGDQMQAPELGPEVAGTSRNELDFHPRLGGVSARRVQHFRFGIDADDLGGEGVEIQREKAGTGAEVQDGLRSIEADKVCHAAGQQPWIGWPARRVEIRQLAETPWKHDIGHQYGRSPLMVTR